MTLVGCSSGGNHLPSSPSSETYRGPSAFSAPETQRLRDFVNSRVVGGVQQIKAHIDWHTCSQRILWPYGYTTASPRACGKRCCSAPSRSPGAAVARSPRSADLLTGGGMPTSRTPPARTTRGPGRAATTPPAGRNSRRAGRELRCLIDPGTARRRGARAGAGLGRLARRGCHRTPYARVRSVTTCPATPGRRVEGPGSGGTGRPCPSPGPG